MDAPRRREMQIATQWQPCLCPEAAMAAHLFHLHHLSVGLSACVCRNNDSNVRTLGSLRNLNAALLLHVDADWPIQSKPFKSAKLFPRQLVIAECLSDLQLKTNPSEPVNQLAQSVQFALKDSWLDCCTCLHTAATFSLWLRA